MNDGKEAMFIYNVESVSENEGILRRKEMTFRNKGENIYEKKYITKDNKDLVRDWNLYEFSGKNRKNSETRK